MQARGRAITTSVKDRRLTLRVVKPAHLALALGIGLVLANGTMALTLLHQSTKEQEIQANTAVARRALQASPVVSLEQLQSTLAQRQAELKTVLSSFPSALHSVSFVDDVLAMSKADQVEIVTLKSRKATTQTVGHHSYTVNSFSLSIQGQPQDLATFVEGLGATQDYTLVVKGNDLVKQGNGALLSIDVDVYTRPAQVEPAPPAQPTATPRPTAVPTKRK